MLTGSIGANHFKGNFLPKAGGPSKLSPVDTPHGPRTQQLDEVVAAKVQGQVFS